MFKLESKKMASHPIFNAVLVSRLFELWNIPNIQIQAGFIHETSGEYSLCPFAWINTKDEFGDDAITDITFYATKNKPVRIIGTEVDFGFLNSLEEYVTIKDTPMEPKKNELKFRYITTAPPHLQIFSKDQASLDDIKKVIKKPDNFIKNCPKSYQDLYKEITDKHSSPGEIDDKIEVTMSKDNLQEFIQSKE